MLRLRQFLSITLCGLPLLMALPEWCIASWIGSCWGALLLAGLSATWTNNRVAWSVYCLLTSGLAHGSLGATTNFGDAANWMIIAVLFASGWFMGVAFIPWNDLRRVPGIELEPSDVSPAQLRFSAWDIFCATALVALFCSTVGAVQNRFDLMCQVGPALAGGILLSILALQWGWRDIWSLSSFIAVLICLPLFAILLVPWTSLTRDYAALAAWLISGPLSVIAAQFIVVLLGCAALRQPRRVLINVQHQEAPRLAPPIH